MRALRSYLLPTSALLAGMLLVAAQSAPATAGKATNYSGFRFFSGSARGNDLNAFVWVGMGKKKAFGSFFDFFNQVAFRMEGKGLSHRNGSLNLTARYPLDQRRIGNFRGDLRNGSLKGKWSAVGRNGNWRLAEAERDTEAMAEIAGSYEDEKTRQGQRRVVINLNAATSEVTFTLLRRDEVFTLSGAWMVDTDGNLWLLGLGGDGTLGGLTPLDLNIRRFPFLAPYRRRENGDLAIRNPLNAEENLTVFKRLPNKE